MAARSPKDNTISLTFGAGINARQRAADISKFECVRGENFDLDGASGAFRRRNAFGYIATAPNGQAIRGYAQLIKRDGTITTLIQAGNVVYLWDGDLSFTVVGNCHGSSRLRGPRRHNWLLDQFVVITDLEKLTPVQMWDGTTFKALPHDLGGDMYAKHCNIHNERIILGNVTTAGVDTPHVMLACKQSSPYNWSDSDRPSSSLGTDAAFYLIVPNFRPINALIDAFGNDVVSTSRDRLFVLTGTSAKDFAFSEFYAGSAISGEEAFANVGNDVFMGRRGRIESLKGTLNFGDVEANDISFQLKPLVENVPEWTLAYEQRTQRVFCFPSNQNCVYVYHKTLADTAQGMSPWSKWTTAHAVGFYPETVMPMINQADSDTDNIAADSIFFGDNVGKIYRIDGDSGKDGARDGDPYWSNVVLLVNFDGADNSTTFVDTSPTVHALAANGNAHIDATNNGIYLDNNSGYFDGSNDWVAIGAPNEISDFDFGSGDFTIETNIKIDTGAPAGSMGITGGDSGSGNVWQVGIEPTPGGQVFYGTAGLTLETTSSVRDNSWHNVAFSRVGTSSYAFFDGALQSTQPSDNITSVLASYEFGSYPVVALGVHRTMKGWLNALRITKGVGRYSATFTPALLKTGPYAAGSDITAYRTSGLVELPDGDVFDAHGWINYRRLFSSTVTISLLYQGVAILDKEITVNLPADGTSAVYNGSAYYGGGFYYGFTFAERISKQAFGIAGISSAVQIKVAVTGDEDFQIEEVGLTFASRV